jgi:two-component system, sensor histidine kinase
MTDTPSEQSEKLREKAEALLQITPAAAEALSAEASKQLLHELQVHQIELELQNEELRKSQTALEEGRSRYLHLYHNAPVGYVVLNRAGIIVQDNATFAGMVGHDYRQLHGKPFADFLVPEDQPIFRARLKAFFKHPDNKHIEVRLGTTGKTSLCVDLAAAEQHHTLQPQQPQDNELLVTVTDITARVKAEEALQRSHKFVLDIIDSLSAHVCVIDGNGEIIAVNKAWRRFSTANPPIAGNIAEGTNYLAICDAAQGEDADIAGAFAAGIRAVLQGHSDMFSLEYPCHSEDEQRWFMGRVTRLTEEAHGQVVVAHENISEQKLMEKEKLQLQTQLNQLEKAESLSRMAGAIAHNFNNTLSAVLGNLELALEDIPDAAPSRSLKAALQATWRALEMSGLMLTYLGQKVESQEAVDFSMICRQAVPLLMLAKPQDIEITTNFPTPGQIVRANAKQIQQVLFSLMANGWESMEDKPGWIKATIGSVRPDQISTEHRFPLDYQIQDDVYACLLVQDSGSGIADKDLDNLFDPFFTSKFPGRGMGLSVVLGILRAHRGAITVESQPGRGSIFRVFLPCLSDQ